jgi:hypothetical protein
MRETAPRCVMRSSPCLCLLLIVGCTRPQSLDPQQAQKALKAQAEEVGRAAVEEDHPKMAELTLPALVDKFGGPAAYVRQLESMAAEMKGQGCRLTKYRIGDPSPLVEASGAVYAVIPMVLELSGPGGAAGRAPSYLIAVSQDGGASWKFVDGAGAGNDRGKVKALLPDFPEQLQLPTAQDPVWMQK